MKKAVINKNKCDHSPFCPVKKVCPVAAVTQKTTLFFRAEVPVIDETKCTGCGLCAQYCPHMAVSLKEVAGSPKARKRA